MATAWVDTHQVLRESADTFHTGALSMSSRWKRRILRTLVYGIFFGAAGMYLYMTQGALLDSSITAMLQWRDGAKESVYGFGGEKS